jgi:hypothetical protein
MSEHEDLRQKYDEFRHVAFPASPTQSDQLTEIHADLAEYDGHVSGVTASILGGMPVAIGALRPDDHLRARLELLRENSSAPTYAEAAEHLDYLGRLDDLLRVALRTART